MQTREQPPQFVNDFLMLVHRGIITQRIKDESRASVLSTQEREIDACNWDKNVKYWDEIDIRGR